MRKKCGVFIGMVLLLVSGCQDLPGPDLIDIPPSLEIVDASHGGREGFYFLPPMVPDPHATGTFDPSFLPFLAVEVCDWTGEECVTPLVARFTSETGRGSARLRIHGSRQHEDDGHGMDDERFYGVRWKTRGSHLDQHKTYRIRVLAGSVELGHADVDVVATGRELRHVDRDQFIPLKNGRTLPIRFRIEEGIVVPVSGTVTSEAAGFPVFGAVLRVGEAAVLTDVAGHFDLGGLELDVVVGVTAPGFYPTTLTVSRSGDFDVHLRSKNQDRLLEMHPLSDFDAYVRVVENSGFAVDNNPATNQGFADAHIRLLMDVVNSGAQATVVEIADQLNLLGVRAAGGQELTAADLALTLEALFHAALINPDDPRLFFFLYLLADDAGQLPVSVPDISPATTFPAHKVVLMTLVLKLGVDHPVGLTTPLSAQVKSFQFGQALASPKEVGAQIVGELLNLPVFTRPDFGENVASAIGAFAGGYVGFYIGAQVAIGISVAFPAALPATPYIVAGSRVAGSVVGGWVATELYQFVKGKFGTRVDVTGVTIEEDGGITEVPVRRNEILFSSSADGSSDTWAIGLDGTVRSNLSRVSHDPNSIFEDGGGRWSPDGSRILFTSNKTPGVPRKIFIMNADGSNAQPMNNNANTEVDPSWGGDGTKIYYGRNPRFPATTGAGCGPCPFWEIYEYDLTTGQETRLTSNNSRDEQAVASPDGNFIAFRRAERPNDCCNPTSVWIMDIDGQNQRRLSPNNNRYETPLDWDPVNNKILTAWSSAIVLMDPDGTAEQLITGATGVAFSPDGSKILVARGGDIYFLDIATRQLTPFLVEPGAQNPSDWGGTSNPTGFARAETSRMWVQLPDGSVSRPAQLAIGSFDFDPLNLERCDLGILATVEVPSGQHVDLTGLGALQQGLLRVWNGF